MFGQYNPYGPAYGMAQAPQSGVIYIPVPATSIPQPTSIPAKKPGKGMTAKKLKKFHAAYEALLKGDKKDDKPKKLRDKTFSWFETTMTLIVFSLPIACGVLAVLKIATLILRSLLI